MTEHNESLASHEPAPLEPGACGRSLGHRKQKSLEEKQKSLDGAGATDKCGENANLGKGCFQQLIYLTRYCLHLAVYLAQKQINVLERRCWHSLPYEKVGDAGHIAKPKGSKSRILVSFSVHDETSLFLTVKVSFGVHSKKR